MFGMGLGLRGPSGSSRRSSANAWPSIDEPTGTYRCERARDGEVLAARLRVGADQEHDSSGEPATGEPPVPWLESDSDAAAIGLSGADVLRFAEAWGTPIRSRCVRAGNRRRGRSWRRNKPIVTQPSASKAVGAGQRPSACWWSGCSSWSSATVGGAVWWVVANQIRKRRRCSSARTSGAARAAWGARRRCRIRAPRRSTCLPGRRRPAAALMRVLLELPQISGRAHGLLPPGEGAEDRASSECRETHARGARGLLRSGRRAAIEGRCSKRSCAPIRAIAALAACD